MHLFAYPSLNAPFNTKELDFPFFSSALLKENTTTKRFFKKLQREVKEETRFESRPLICNSAPEGMYVVDSENRKGTWEFANGNPSVSLRSS